MKRNWLISAAALLLTCGLAWAVQEGTKTPIAAGETGENSLSQGEVFNVARFKPGLGTLSVTVSGAAAAGTLNTAAGIITAATATAGASGTAPTVITLTNNKVQAGDLVLCVMDQTGITAGAVITCSPHVTASTIAFTLADASVTAMTSSTIILYYLVVTKGNPN